MLMKQFKKIFLGTILFILSSFAAVAQISNSTSAGQVITVVGVFQAHKADTPIRSLQRGTDFYTGETLITGNKSTAQVRFTDGTVVALYPNSKYQVTDYVYETGKSKNNHSVTRLIEGGFRAITGLISKANPDAYKVETPVAVIGVRGTNYGVTLDNGKLYAGVWRGGIFLKNESGLIRLGEGEDYQFASVNAANAAPIGLLVPPQQLIGSCAG